MSRCSYETENKLLFVTLAGIEGILPMNIFPLYSIMIHDSPHLFYCYFSGNCNSTYYMTCISKCISRLCLCT